MRFDLADLFDDLGLAVSGSSDSSSASLIILPAAHDVIRSPGATRSGFNRPSPVGPLEEKYDTPYVCGASRCVAPTVMASSALPGSLMVFDKPTLVTRLL